VAFPAPDQLPAAAKFRLTEKGLPRTVNV
jgi:hypothetical protein